MYPFIRLMKEHLAYRRSSLDLLGTHVSRHICWPWDLDPWRELNNGRTLTLFDLGRIPLMTRTGMVQSLIRHRWGVTVAGGSLRYRRRVRIFHRFELRSRIIGWDHRFLYVEHAMWRNGEALNHALLRLAVTDAAGILAPGRLVEAIGDAGRMSPPMPDWVIAWIAADAQRPWPPERGAEAQSGGLA